MEQEIISVVIPCYNQGIFLKEALDSLELCDKKLFEVIIINDGSTDHFTNKYTERLYEQGHHVIFQENSGLGQARNIGIKQAKGKYILPLDADNKIYPGYISKSLEILEKNEHIAVVYGNANFFGEKGGILKPGPFNLQKLMLGNYIDACAVIRKSVIEEVGLYENMKIMGYEDWDLWLRMAFAGHKFYYIDEVMFDYRVLASSMMRNLNRDIEKQNKIEQYFIEKYSEQLSPESINDRFIYKMKKSPLNFFYRLVLRKFFPSYYSKLIKENKMYIGYFYDRI